MSQTIAASPPRTGRLIAPAAVLAPLLTVAAFTVVGEPPSADATAREVVAYYSSHETGVLASSALTTLAAAALVWFAAQLHAHIRAFGRETAMVVFGAAVLVGAGFTIFAGIEATAAMSADELTPQALQTLNALDNGMYFTIALGVLLLYGGLAVAALRDGAFPRPLGWVLAGLTLVAFTPAFFVTAAASIVVLPLLGRIVAR